MNVLSLGTARRRLFALHDPAVLAARAMPRAAVICNPGGAELVHAHRSLRHLALRLSRRGFHVLRFDYYGTGDSEGEDGEADPAGMQQDTEFALEAARDIAGVAQVALIGLRLGAGIAAQASLRRSGEVESLVLWDPLQVPELPAGLRQRSLLLVTDGAAVAGAEAVAAPCCWVESITASGALPVAAFQRMEQWLR